MYCDYASLAKTVTKGSHILLDDGIIRLEVLEPSMHTGTSEYTDVREHILIISSSVVSGDRLV